MSLFKKWFSKKKEGSDSSYEQDNVDDSSTSDYDFDDHLDPEVPYCESDSTSSCSDQEYSNSSTESFEDSDTNNNQNNEESSNSKPSTKIIDTKNVLESIKTERENDYTEKEMDYKRCDEDYPTDLKFFWYLSDEDFQKSHCCISCIFISQLQCCFGNLCSHKRKESIKEYFTSMTFIITFIDVFVYLLLICLDTSSLDFFLKPNATLLMKSGAYIYHKWYGGFTYSFIHKNWIHLLIDLVLFNNISIMIENYIGQGNYILCYWYLHYIGWFYSIFYFNNNICIAGNSPIYFGFLGFYMMDSIFHCLIKSDRKKEKIDSIVVSIFITLLLVGFCLIDKYSAIATISGFLYGVLMGLCSFLQKVWFCILFGIIYFAPFFLPWVCIFI